MTLTVKNIKTLFLLFAIFCSQLSIAQKKENADNEQNSNQTSIDFNKISPHPRLLLKKGEEKEIRKLISSNIDFGNIHDHIIKYADKQITEPTLKYEVVGKRLLGVSRDALKKIFYLSYAYRMLGDSKYAERAKEEILNVCDFQDWHPQHYLDVAEMALGVSIGYDWLYDELSAKEKQKIEKALKEYALETSKNTTVNWWLTKTNNWNQVCNGGILAATLAIYETNKEESLVYINRYLESTKLPLNFYDPDGNYPEGYAYWSYGTGYQVISLEMLNTAFGADNGLSKYPGFLKTANFLMFMGGSPADIAYNHSDGGSNLSGNPYMFWLAKKNNDFSLLYKEKKILAKGTYLRSSLEDRTLPLALIFGRNIDFRKIPVPKQNIYIGGGETPIAVIRTNWDDDAKALYLGMKGGKASSSHAHMDAGSFTFDAMGIRWAMDMGSQNYNSLEERGIDLWNMKQKSTRWSIYRLNNFSHNVITVNDQLFNVDGKADILEEYRDENKLGLKFEMAQIYAGQVKTATRSVTLINQAYAEIADDILANEKDTKLTWRMVTPAKAEIIDNKTIKLTKNNKTVLLQVENPNVTLKIWDNESKNSFEVRNTGTLRVGFETVLPANQSIQLKVKLIPQI